MSGFNLAQAWKRAAKLATKLSKVKLYIADKEILILKAQRDGAASREVLALALHADAVKAREKAKAWAKAWKRAAKDNRTGLVNQIERSKNAYAGLKSLVGVREEELRLSQGRALEAERKVVELEASIKECNAGQDQCGATKLYKHRPNLLGVCIDCQKTVTSSRTHTPECSTNDPSCFYQADCDCAQLRAQEEAAEIRETRQQWACLDCGVLSSGGFQTVQYSAGDYDVECSNCGSKSTDELELAYVRIHTMADEARAALEELGPGPFVPKHQYDNVCKQRDEAFTALQHLYCVLGPEVPASVDCDGCSAEWSEALRTLRTALGVAK